MKIIVTGGSGYLGAHVRQFLEAEDFSRRTTSRDILSEADCAMLEDYDAVVHLAAFLDKTPAYATESFRINAEGTANVLRSLRPGAAFVYVSTKDVYGPHAANYDEVPEGCPTLYSGQSALEWSKLLGEHYTQYYGAARNLRTCVFRLSTCYAPPTPNNEPGFVGHYLNLVREGWPVRLPGGGTPVRDLLHVDDLARACRAFIDSSVTAGLYNLGGGRDNALSLRSLVETMGRLLETTPNIDEDARTPAPVPLNYVSDITKIEGDLGWRPQMDTEEGLRTLL
jgi:nucleoside-diphosphate-sugar epimerase